MKRVHGGTHPPPIHLYQDLRPVRIEGWPRVWRSGFVIFDWRRKAPILESKILVYGLGTWGAGGHAMATF